MRGVSAMTDMRPKPDDPLREGLILLCRQLGRDVEFNALGDGFPLEGDRLALDDVARALRRADISARVITWPLQRITQRLLPVLLHLDDGTWVLLTGWQGDEAVLLDPTCGGGERRASRAELNSSYARKAVVARPNSLPDSRADDFASPKAQHWLHAPLRAAWPAFGQAGLAAMVANLLAIGTSLFAMQVYDRVVPSNAFDTLWILASGVALALVMELALRAVRANMLDAAGKRIDLLLSSRLFEHALSVRLAAKPSSTGAFSSQLREFDSVREFFTSTTAGAVADLPFVALFVVLLFFIGGAVAWVPIVGIALMVLPGLVAQRPLATLSRQHLREGAVKNAMLLEAVENLEAVKASRAEGRLLRRWDALSAEISGTALKVRSLNAMLAHGGAFIQQAAYTGVIVFGVYRIAAGELTVGGLVACSILTSRALSPLMQAATLLARWQHVKVALEGLDRLMETPIERQPGRTFARRPNVRGHYALEDIELRYAPDASPALAINRLVIGAGERVALLGAMGAGKSTLMRVLAGLLDVGSGKVLLDNLAIGQIDPSDRRSAIGYLPQDTMLFHGTLRDNLSIDLRGIDDDERWSALDMVGLGPFVRAHPLGLDMPIHGSACVSGGQRQAIGLARLIIQDPRVVLLDEPTAAFDQESEQRVIEALLPWLKGRTLVLSTHKRNLLSLVDRAVVLQQGRITMDGTLPNVVRGREVTVLAATKASAVMEAA